MIVFLFGFIVAFSAFAQETEGTEQEQQTEMTEQQTQDQTQEEETTTQQEQQTQEKKPEVEKVEGVLYSDGGTNYASLGVKFKINATDEMSGVKNIFFMTDKDASFKTYFKPFGGFMNEGRHFISYKMEDNVGNMSTLKYYEFTLDLTAPELYIDTDKKVVTIGQNIYVGADYQFSMYAYDKLSGVQKIEYYIDDQNFTVYSDKFTIQNPTTGLHRINFRAVDNVGNVSATQQYTVFVDNNAPTVNFVVEPPIFVKDGVNYIASDSVIKIQADDEETAVEQILYSVDGGEFKEYRYTIQRLAPGEHTIKAKAVDLVGNESQEFTLTVNVDSKSPEGQIVPQK
jgi:hypothetical protein